ncbi:uncharacterized protein PGTG_21201, partial [Puccinia graminis f. sp. tritici CRL 75-36-700-3]
MGWMWDCENCLLGFALSLLLFLGNFGHLGNQSPFDDFHRLLEEPPRGIHSWSGPPATNQQQALRLSNPSRCSALISATPLQYSSIDDHHSCKDILTSTSWTTHLGDRISRTRTHKRKHPFSMHSHLAVLLGSLNLALAQTAPPDAPVLNTPSSVVQCLPTLLTFHGGTPPYTLTAIPAGQVGALPLADLGPQTGESYTWVTNLAAGTATTLQIRDSKGNINYSQAVTVQPSSDSSCLKSGNSPSPTTPPSGSPTPPSTAPPTVSSGTASANPPSKGGNNTASTPSAQPNNTTPATMPNGTSSAGSSTNSSKGPSPFVPPSSTTTPSTSTPVNNNANTPANNAPGSAASSVSAVSQQAFFAGLAVAASVLAVFA